MKQDHSSYSSNPILGLLIGCVNSEAAAWHFVPAVAIPYDAGSGATAAFAVFRQVHSARQVALRHLHYHRVVRIDHIGHADLSELGDGLVSLPLVKFVVCLEPLYHFHRSNTQGIGQGSHAADRHNEFARFDARPGELASFDHVELENDFHGGLQPRAAEFAIALQGVAIAEIEVSAIVEDREIQRRALCDVAHVHVSAEITRPQPGPSLFAFRCDGHAAQHRAERNLQALLALRQVEYVNGAVLI